MIRIRREWAPGEAPTSEALSAYDRNKTLLTQIRSQHPLAAMDEAAFRRSLLREASASNASNIAATHYDINALIDELSRAARGETLADTGGAPAGTAGAYLSPKPAAEPPPKRAVLESFDGDPAPEAAKVKLASRQDPFADPWLEEQKRRYSLEGVVEGIAKGVKDRVRPFFEADAKKSGSGAGIRRKLTPNEAKQIKETFGSSVDIRDVTIIQGAGDSALARIAFLNGAPAITIGNKIYFQKHRADFTATPDDLRLFAHEMNHVRQYQQHGKVGVFARIGDQAFHYGADGAYVYQGRNYPYQRETLEGQSQIAGDYARYRKTGDLPRRRVIGGRTYGVTADELEAWAKGSGLYGK